MKNPVKVQTVSAGAKKFLKNEVRIKNILKMWSPLISNIK